ncbi:MAG: serine/threonine protein kinase [Anaerolineae bacterium]|nr:serine/threonine protein kinase [Anaerolineae bacterium]
MGPASLEGLTLGKYRVLEPLGRGGMARVYRAYHPQLDRYVAIKVMRTDLADDEEFQVRFQREARAVAALRHPNIVQVFDFDIEGDISFMVMELMAGDTLKTRLDDYRARGERMPWGEMLRVMLDVLEGLAYAHSEGMIHRDIKPGNILLTQRGQAVLADFGVAHIIGGTRYTAPNALMGTLQYMAPEQGMEGRSDARSDIYSLGIVLYEMLTQQRPFDADTPLAVLMKHVNDPLPLPRQINAAIPEPLERVVLKALAKKPEERYQGAQEMARALRAAAQEMELTLPERISLPLSFTTPEAPSESVAVISGTTRKFVMEAGASFAEGETDATSGNRRMSQMMAGSGTSAGDQDISQAGKELLNAVGAVANVAIHRTTDALRKVTETATGSLEKAAAPILEAPKPEDEPKPGSGGKAILSALGAIGLANLVMLTLSAVLGNWGLYEHGWPIQLFLGSLFLSVIMYITSSVWLMIPAGVVFGTGLILSYCSLTGRWDDWGFLWILEVWVVVVSVLAPNLLSKHGEGRMWGRQLAWLIGGASVITSVAVAGVSVIVGVITTEGPLSKLWFILVVAVVTIAWWLRSRNKSAGGQKGDKNNE